MHRGPPERDGAIERVTVDHDGPDLHAPYSPWLARIARCRSSWRGRGRRVIAARGALCVLLLRRLFMIGSMSCNRIFL
jgi:hypothetical protein